MSDNSSTLLARRDIEAIKSLRENPAFKGYWMRRLKDRIGELEYSFKYDAVTPKRREQIRLVLLELEEFLGMMDKDFALAERLLTDFS